MSDLDTGSTGCLGCSPCGNGHGQGHKDKGAATACPSLGSSVATIATIADLLPSDKSIEAGDKASPDTGRKHHHYKQEKCHILAAQVTVPFFIAGMGTIGAGVVFGKVAVSTYSLPIFISLSVY